MSFPRMLRAMRARAAASSFSLTMQYGDYVYVRRNLVKNFDIVPRRF